MHLAILRVHKDEQSYNRHWQSQERLDLTGITGLFKTDLEGQIVHKARNEVVEMALSSPDWDVALMVDDDMMLHPGTIQQARARMEARPDIHILTGVYFEKRFPHTPQLYDLALEEVFKNKYWPVIDYRERADSEGMVEVDACGAGILFVRRGVFEAVRRPWFQFLDRMGEDFYFCRKAKTAGYKIWCDVNMQALHVGVIEIGEYIFAQVRPMLKRVLPPEGDTGVSVEGYEMAGGNA